MDPFPFERLPIKLKTKIIRFAIPSVPACFTKWSYGWNLDNDFIHVHEEDLNRVRASCLEIKTICDRIRYLVVCTRGQEVCRLDPLRDIFVTAEPWIGFSDATQLPREQGPESSQPGGPPIRRMFCRMGDPSLPRGAPVLQTGNALPENEEQAYAQMPFDSSLPIWPRTPMLKEFTLTSALPAIWAKSQPKRLARYALDWLPWINRPGEPIDAEQSQYGWIEVKAPEEGDDPWVEQVATTWKMVRYLLKRSNGLMDFEWHLDNK